MSSFLTILTLGAMVLTGGVLLWGLVEMARGKNNTARTNQLMRYRVLFQGAALILFAALAYFTK